MSAKKQKKGVQPTSQAKVKRPVDVAMRADRPAKISVRGKWLEILREIGVPEGPHPVYLTLPGAEGKDVQLLIDENLISTTETGAISTESKLYCVAVENSPLAVLELQKKFPGLRILEQNIQSVLRGDSVLAYPARGDERTFCQAHVVNLDLQATLEGSIENDDALFPVIRWIEKFGNLHRECSHRRWHLLLTLNATVQWTVDLCEWVTTYLKNNLEAIQEFRAGATRLLDAEIMADITAGRSVTFGNLSLADRQRVLLLFVPKVICHRLSGQGWNILTRFNAEYPGANGAPMVTYIFDLSMPQEPRMPNQLYTDAISRTLQNVATVTEAGDVQQL